MHDRFIVGLKSGKIGLTHQKTNVVGTKQNKITFEAINPKNDKEGEILSCEY